MLGKSFIEEIFSNFEMKISLSISIKSLDFFMKASTSSFFP